MTHKKKVSIVRNYLKKLQAWVNKTPGVINVSMDINGKEIILAEKTPQKC